jgi:putative thioredoxin
MAESLVFDVTMENFVDNVVQLSHEIPVLVDFWAEWCGPCKALTPVLEKLAYAYQGRFVLAKVDTEANPQLAAQLQIRSLPSVKLIIGGKLVAEFQGVQPEAEIRRFIETYCPAIAKDPFASAEELQAGGELEAALEVITGLLAKDPAHVRAQPLKAQLLIQLKRWDEAAAFLENAKFPEAESYRKQLKMFAEARGFGELEALRKKVEDNPSELDGRYRYAMVLALEGHFQDSFEQLLTILAKDKTFADGKIRKTLLGMFELLGLHHPLSDEYRRRMGRLIL